MNKSKAKILLLDIETAPAISYTWGLYDQNIGINQIVKDGYVLCWCAKWLGAQDILSDALVNYPKRYKKNPCDDSAIAKSIHSLMEQADIVVTHNGNSFDLKWLNTIFINNGLPPTNPNKSVDTCVEARKHFRFLSNKLDFLSQKFDFGKKIDTGGFELWTGCMNGDAKCWRNMVVYCKHDVRLLEKLYVKLRPYIKSHPNLNLYEKKPVNKCPKCASHAVQRRGYEIKRSNKYQRFQCQDCGSWFSSNVKAPKGESHEE